MQTIVISTKPVSINARYTISRGKNILSRDYRSAKEAIAWEINSQWHEDLITEDVTLNFLIYYKGRKPDIDAYHKIVLDAMTGVVYKDDAQVNELHTFRMQDKDNPRLIVQIL